MSNNKDIKNKIISELEYYNENGSINDSDGLITSLSDYTWSYSKLKTIINSHYNFLMSFLKPFEDTRATILGKVIHAMIQQDEEYRYAEKKFNGKTKAGKQEAAAAAANGVKLLTTTDMDIVRSVAKSINRNKDVEDLLVGGFKIEQWLTMEHDGFNFGGYIDVMTDDYAVEIKTTDSIDKDSMTRKFTNYDYQLQAYLYSKITKKPIKYIICETSFPYRVIVTEPNEDYLAYGKMRFEKSVTELENLLDNVSNGCISNYIDVDDGKLGISSWDARTLENYSREN